MDKKEVTVDSVRQRLRGDVFMLAFYAGMFNIEKRSEEKKVAAMSADNLARFGVNSGLIAEDELREWQGAIHKNEPCLADVTKKYCPENAGVIEDGNG